MAKLTRDHLKELVKECLFEILLDASDTSEVMQESRTANLASRTKKISNKKRAKPAPKTLHPSLENLSYKKQDTGPKVNAAALTSDPIMAAIFEDTAATTLREQIAAERGGPVTAGDSASRIASTNDPTDLFSESSQNWAALAFSDSPKK